MRSAYVSYVGQSTSSPCVQKDVWTRPQQTRKRPAAPSASSGRQRFDRLTLLERHGLLRRRRRRDQRERDEREEPREVQVEPVRQHELEADQDGGGERGEPERRAAARHERERERTGDEQNLQ